ncbi:MAG: endolytic transglycosylase MltG [Clostridia bacterium]|nr:endolytic transglycosylase MltG [Clostridia bacterium]
MEWRFILNTSFLRGLGVGLIIASLLIIGWPPGRPGLTQQEILTQAAQLGMITKEEAAQQVEKAVYQALVKEKKENQDPQPNLQSPQPPKTLATGETKPVTPPQAAPVTITIPSGSASIEIAEILLKAGVITNKEEFLALVDKKKAASKFRIGTYQLQKEMPLEELIRVLTRRGNGS